jgi:hypothetical protein
MHSAKDRKGKKAPDFKKSGAGITIAGGKMQYAQMTLELFKHNKREYLLRKIYAWIDLYNQSMRPEKWYKPNKKGTGAKFTMIRTSAEQEEAMKELNRFVMEVNEELGTDFKVRIEEANGQTKTRD